jgi:hypothetical protein
VQQFSAAYAQSSRVPEQEAAPGQPTVGQPQTSGSRTTTGQGLLLFPVEADRTEQKVGQRGVQRRRQHLFRQLTGRGNAHGASVLANRGTT